jgi:hypothetical protein
MTPSCYAPPTEYLPIKPLGLGGFEVESLGSYFCRMAKAHSVSISVLRNHLALWWARHSGSHFPNVSQNVVAISGFNETTRKFVEILSEATGCEQLRQTTLLVMQPAASKTARGVARRYRNWCPACLHDSIEHEKEFYDRLLWTLPAVKRCTVHRLLLESECPHCGSLQSWYPHKGDTTLCWKCKNSLLPPIARWKPFLQPYFGESDCIDLIDHIGQGALVVQRDAFQAFAKGLRRTLSEFHISPKNSMYGTIGYKHSRREQDRPCFRIMLQQCVSLGVPLTHVLAEPVSAARSTGLLEFAKIAITPRHAMRYSNSQRVAAKARLTEELAKPIGTGLPPLSLIAKELGVSQGFLAYRFGDLVAQYQKRRRCWKEEQLMLAHRRACAMLEGGLLDHYPSVRFPSQDHLVAEMCARGKVNIRVARAELLEALARRRQDGSRAR